MLLLCFALGCISMRHSSNSMRSLFRSIINQFRVPEFNCFGNNSPVSLVIRILLFGFSRIVVDVVARLMVGVD